MKRGGKFSGSVALLALTACGTQPALQIRATPAPLSAQVKPVPIRIAEGRAQFALGNVALALESFRKAARDDPSSTDALLGIAACYDRMGRFDLSRRNYESALAIAPRDPQLLAALAGSLDQQGKRDEAAAVRREIAVRLAVSQPPRPAPAAPVAPPRAAAATPAVRTIAAPQEQPQPQLATTRAIELAATARDLPVRIAQLPAPAAAAPQPLPAAPRPVAALQPLPEPEIGASVTVALPPPRPAAAILAHAESIPEPAPEPQPASSPEPAPASRPEPVPVRSAAAEVPETSGPRIERLSMGVVALITGDAPRWEATTVARSDRSTTVKFVPLREANARARPTRVRVLNAARVERLAARTRSWLTARGWGRMAIGDAPAARSRSLIVYPAGQRALAQTLSNQFGFAMEERSDAKFVTMLLGRDAARIEELRPKSA